jgi:ABC-type Fe3+/spermidine/putrescine transport system ATPase subunit
MPTESLLKPPAVQGRHLTRTFGAGGTLVTALADVRLDLSPGEVALLLGPSGSVKTTLLAVLSGLLHPTAGQVLALGEDLWQMSDKQCERFRLRHVGFVFQGYNLLAALTARQQLELVPQRDLGADSLDLLEIMFRLEREFGIEVLRGELFPQRIFRISPELVHDGKLTEKGLEELHARMPFADLSEFEKDPELSHVGDLFTVELVTRYVAGKLG